MKFTDRRRLVLLALGVFVAAGVIATVFWTRRPDSTPNEAAPGGGRLSDATSAPEIPPEPDLKAFAHLPPAERINAETKARMERNAAWREKLRNGNYSTLPPEAWPASARPAVPAGPQ